MSQRNIPALRLLGAATVLSTTQPEAHQTIPCAPDEMDDCLLPYLSVEEVKTILVTLKRVKPHELATLCFAPCEQGAGPQPWVFDHVRAVDPPELDRLCRMFPRMRRLYAKAPVWNSLLQARLQHLTLIARSALQP